MCFCGLTNVRIVFNIMKKLLTEAPVLAFPNFSKPFILYTDASAVAIGIVLSQLDEHGKDKLDFLYISYFKCS